MVFLLLLILYRHQDFRRQVVDHMAECVTLHVFYSTFIYKELMRLQKSPPAGAEIIIPSEEDIHHWLIKLSGPESTPYSKGTFDVDLEFPEQYPFKPPKIHFKTKIYHPNIKNETGEICAAILYDEWQPTLNVAHCLEVLLNMLKSPNADSPLEEEIAVVLRDKPKEFEKTAKQWTKQYAM